MLITFEGSEAVGKSTLIKAVSNFLIQKNIDHLCTREPGGTPLAEKIRNLIFDNVKRPSSMVELLLMFAARRDHVEHVIMPALKQNKIVLCDRYIDSSYVYQSTLQQVDENILHHLVNDFVVPTLPDLCFIIDCDPQISYERIQKRGIQNANDAYSMDYFHKIRQGFLERSQKNTLYPYIVIDNSNDMDKSIRNIIEHIEKEI